MVDMIGVKLMHKLLPGAPGTLPDDLCIVYPTQQFEQFPAHIPLPSLSKGCRFGISGHSCTALPSSACYTSCTMQAVWMSTVPVSPRVATQTGAEGQVVAAQAKVSPHASSSPALLHPSSDLSVGMLSTDRTVYSRSSCMSTTQCLCAGCQALLYKQPAADWRRKEDLRVSC